MLQGGSEPNCIKVAFDNKDVGAKCRRQSVSLDDQSTVSIDIEEENIGKKCIRKQFR